MYAILPSAEHNRIETSIIISIHPSLVYEVYKDLILVLDRMDKSNIPEWNLISTPYHSTEVKISILTLSV